jgi:phosphatidylglycerophosphatase A
MNPHALAAPRRPDWRYMFGHPARWLALGLGSGLARRAPGTVGSLWGWAGFLVLDLWLDDAAWGWVIAAGLVAGWWACSRTAAELGQADPSAIVWDEVIAVWIILWLVIPAGLAFQALAFALFRYFDAAKPGPVAWADAWLEHRPQPWARGLGILLDDLVAAGCTLLVLAAAVVAGDAWQAAWGG